MTQPKKSESVISRRDSLRLIGLGGAAAIVGLTDNGPINSWSRPASGMTTNPGGAGCIVRPAQTEGPYFMDEKLNRADIRTDPSDNSIKEGAPLKLRINVSKLDDAGTCRALPGAFVDVWQCDALGVYSDFQDINGLFDTRGKKFLRGYQVTDGNGSVEMMTIYPGWYSGRTVHIHLKIRLFTGTERAHEYTSQLYFDDSFTDQVYQQAPYNRKGVRKMRNDGDFIFKDKNTGEKLILDVTRSGEGYDGRFDIALAMVSSISVPR